MTLANTSFPPPMLDRYVYNLLSMKRFHEASAGNAHECSLK
jgi:hypothetical protein